jgi:hypothetical protein
MYFVAVDQWTKDINAAHDFKGSVAAIQCASLHGLTNVEVVHAFSDPNYNFSSQPMSFSGKPPAERESGK